MSGTIPAKIIVRALQEHQYCPVQSLYKYINTRNLKPGALFAYPSGHPVSRHEFISQPNSCVTFNGLSNTLYKGHSFRVGGASFYAEQGKSDAQIRAMGRWRSNAF